MCEHCEALRAVLIELVGENVTAKIMEHVVPRLHPFSGAEERVIDWKEASKSLTP